MENQNQWNKELLYSTILFVVANVMLLTDPLYKISELILSLLPLTIKSKFLFSGLLPAFEQATNSMIIVVSLLLLGSVYFGIKSLRKTPTLAYISIFLSSFYIIMIINGLIGYFF